MHFHQGQERGLLASCWLQDPPAYLGLAFSVFNNLFWVALLGSHFYLLRAIMLTDITIAFEDVRLSLRWSQFCQQWRACSFFKWFSVIIAWSCCLTSDLVKFQVTWTSFLIECPSLCNSSICWLGFSYAGYPLWVSSLPSSFSHQRFPLPRIRQDYYHLVFLEMKMKSLLSNFIPSLLLLVAIDFCNMSLP